MVVLERGGSLGRARSYALTSMVAERGRQTGLNPYPATDPIPGPGACS